MPRCRRLLICLRDLNSVLLAGAPEGVGRELLRPLTAEEDAPLTAEIVSIRAFCTEKLGPLYDNRPTEHQHKIESIQVRLDDHPRA